MAALIQQKVRKILQKSSLIHTNELFEELILGLKICLSKHSELPTAFVTRSLAQLDWPNGQQPYKQVMQPERFPLESKYKRVIFSFW
jgi:hypothetical protein